MEAEKLRAQRVEEVAKLDSALAEIEALETKVHESQCEMASLTKKFETLNNYQKLTFELLEKANLEFTRLKDANQFYEAQMKPYL